MSKLNLMKKTAIFSTIFSIIVLVVVFFAMENRVLLADNRFTESQIILPSDEAADNIVDIVVPTETTPRTEINNQNNDSLIFELGSADTNFLVIPVPAGTRRENVTINNHYLIDEMWIIIENVDEDFYSKNIISGNRRNILGGTYEKTDGNAILRFMLDDIYEYRSIIEDDMIYVEFVPPREMHHRIIVIDPAFGGSETGIIANDLMEKDVVLSIALKLKDLLDETDYMVYYTRHSDTNLSDEKRVRIANNTRADMLIRIEGDSNDDSLVNGTTTVYNASFFIPHFGSLELADILEREVVLSIRGKAIGLKPATADDYVISNANVPAAAIRVGHLTNAQEAILLKRDDYLDKIAIGIFNAIQEIFGEED